MQNTFSWYKTEWLKPNETINENYEFNKDEKIGYIASFLDETSDKSYWNTINVYFDKDEVLECFEALPIEVKSYIENANQDDFVLVERDGYFEYGLDNVLSYFMELKPNWKPICMVEETEQD